MGFHTNVTHGQYNYTVIKFDMNYLSTCVQSSSHRSYKHVGKGLLGEFTVGKNHIPQGDWAVRNTNLIEKNTQIKPTHLKYNKVTYKAKNNKKIIHRNIFLRKSPFVGLPQTIEKFFESLGSNKNK